MDWGSKGIDPFTPTTHSELHAAIDPAKLPQFSAPFVVCVIGAARDIGAGIAKCYAKAGATGIVLTARNAGDLDEVTAACRKINPNAEIEAVACDITNIASVGGLADVVRARFNGRLDIVVNTAGYAGTACTTDMLTAEPESYQQAINVNYVGTFHVVHELVPLLLATTSGVNTFISVSSIAALIVRGPIANAQYCVGKLAQLKLMEHLHEEYSGRGLRVFSVHPGAVDSTMARLTTPEVFVPYLTDSPDLCGGFCVWLTAPGADHAWLCGRLLSARWDPEELEKLKDEVVTKDLLKTRLIL